MPGAFYNDSRAWQKSAALLKRLQQAEPSAEARQEHPHSFHARESSIRPQRKLLRSKRLKKTVIAVTPLRYTPIAAIGDKKIISANRCPVNREFGSGGTERPDSGAKKPAREPSRTGLF